LPNIGPVTAVKIYRFREAYGLFKNVEDIKKVEGIGPAITACIRYWQARKRSFYENIKYYINEPKAH